MGGQQRKDVVSLNRQLERLSHRVTLWAGNSWAFAVAVLLLLIWAVTGPFFRFSEAWQLVVNTGTTIVTFLMVFLIQRAQNKESQAVQIKLNELLAAQKGASNSLINVEDMDEVQIRSLHKKFTALAEKLKDAADDRDTHSIDEARDSLEDAHAHLHGASQPASRQGDDAA